MTESYPLILDYLSDKHGDDIVHVFVDEFNAEGVDESEVEQLKNIFEHRYAESHILLVAQSMESQRCRVNSFDDSKIVYESYQYEKLVNEANFYLHHLKYSMRFSTHINKVINIARMYLGTAKVTSLVPDINVSVSKIPLYFTTKKYGAEKLKLEQIEDKDKSLKLYTTLKHTTNYKLESQYKFIGKQKTGHNIKGIVPRIYYPCSIENRAQSCSKRIFCLTLLLNKIIEGKEKYIIVCMNKYSFHSLYIALAVMGTYKYTYSPYEFFHDNYQILVTDYTKIRGCEYANIILIYPTNESHYVDCISRCLYNLRIIVFDEYFEFDSTMMQILSEWEERKLLDSFKVVISSDEQFFLECDMTKELIGNDTDYLEFKEVYEIKTTAREHEVIDKLCFGAIQPLQVEDKEAELAMIKRHEIYFQQVKKFGPLFDVITACDQCDQHLTTRPIEYRYRCLICIELGICQNCYISGNNPQKHAETHTIICLRYKCASCGGYIVGTRFNCTVCPDFDLCLGCFDREPFPASHNISHKMTRSSNLPKDILTACDKFKDDVGKY